MTDYKDIKHEYDRDDLLRKAFNPIMSKTSDVYSMVHGAWGDIEEDDHTILFEKLEKAGNAAYNLHLLIEQLQECAVHHYYDEDGKLIDSTE